MPSLLHTCVHDGLTRDSPQPKSIPPRAVLAFFHGFSDHCNAYYEFFPTLADRGIEVRAVDQRGWGRSVTQPSERGLTGPTTLVLADMHSFLLSLSSQSSPLRNGPQHGWRPITHLHFPSGITLQHPQQQQQQQSITPNPLRSNDILAPHRITSINSPIHAKSHPRSNGSKAPPALAVIFPCGRQPGTLEGLAGMLDRGLWLEGIATGGQRLHADGGERVPPMWFCHGDDDRINLYDATRRFAEVIDVGDKMFKRYKGGFHRLHAEPDGMKDQFATDVAEWILGKCPAWGNTSSGSRTGSMDGKGDGGLVQGEGDSNIKSPADAGTRADWTQGMKEVVKPKL
ncbi:hypothetical protein DTO021C3_2808 [Paecilomyces variotii]|nr:hypothetical protein DTO021C3_2808 [Paecilomyces variotii]